MKAEIIAVGTELLLGQVVNTNATFLSEELAALGIEVYYHTVVGDNPVRLEQMIAEATNRSDLIVLCGGLGPTEDDVTKDVVANYLNCDLVQNEQALRKLHTFFEGSNRKMTENNLRQTLMIKGGHAIQNPTGLAVGSLITKNQTTYLLLPGPPSELRPMFFENARPLVAQFFPQKEKLYSVVMRFYGIGESQLVTELAELIRHQTNPTIAPYAKTNEVTLRLTAKTETEIIAKKLLKKMEQEVMAKVGTYFYGYGENNSLEEVTVTALIDSGKTITAAESLTAGLFQSTLGNVAGVSEVFKGGFVTYSLETKVDFLGIPSDLLDETGTVSEACAIVMAEKARELANTDYAISFTGVAGPEELEGQAAGTVWIGFAQKGMPAYAEFCQFNRDRSYIRQSAVMKGLDMVRRTVSKEK